MQYNLNSNNMLNMPKKNTLIAAEKLLNGKLYVDPWFDEQMDYSINTLNWNVQYSKAPTTHQLYLQGLTPIAYLTGAFVLSGKKDYIKLAIDFFYNWDDFQKSDESVKNEYIWDEHATAIRAESILYLALVASESNEYIDKKIDYSINQHAEWLFNDNNYLYGTNHGVYEDKALLYLGYAINNYGYIEIAKKRISDEVNEMFSHEAVSTENSFNYHRINKELFSELGFIFNNLNDDYGDELLDLAGKAEDFMGYAIKPDGNCATYGDTLLADYKNCSYIDENSVLAYVSNKWNKNVKTQEFEPEKIIAYPESGYFICREFWDNKNEDNLQYEDATWLLFKSGYTKITHKQADDNSFSLYSRGHDIFVDCGMYNYMYRNPIRHYVRTANAHNLVIADETSFEFLREDLKNRCGIAYSYIDDTVGYVIGYNCLYHGILMLRHLIFCKNSVFILDEIESNYEHKYSQLFHLGKNIKINYASNKNLVASIGDSKSYVEIEQFDNQNNIDIEIVNGNYTEIQGRISYGIMSEAFNKFLSIDTVKFNNIGCNCEFSTSIIINDINCEKRTFKYNKDSRSLSIMGGAIL